MMETKTQTSKGQSEETYLSLIVFRPDGSTTVLHYIFAGVVPSKVELNGCKIVSKKDFPVPPKRLEFFKRFFSAPAKSERPGVPDEKGGSHE